MYKKYKTIKQMNPLCIRIVLLFAMLQIWGVSFAQKSITLDENQAPLMSVFKKISSQTGIDFLVTNRMLTNANPVTIKARNVQLADVLKQIFADQPLSYTIRKNSVVVKKKKSIKATVKDVSQPEVSRNRYGISGSVTDERNLPFSGVSVMLENSGIQGVTDAKGNFALPYIPENGTLIFRYVGYQQQSVPVNSAREFTVSMKTETQGLEEVAVVSTGYQSIEKERATGSFSKADMKIFNDRKGNSDIIGRLEGLLPGLVLKTGLNNQSSNSFLGNGNQTQKSTIRGESSIKLNMDPLYVVNGVPVTNINLFNPDDIAEVTVLKDAAAAAIWGAQAANGVILITTKSAEKNGRLNVSYTASFNFMGKPDYSYGRMMNSAELIQTTKELFDPVLFPITSLSNEFVAPHERILYDQYAKYGNKTLDAQATESLDSLAGIDNTSQIKELINRNSLVQSHTASLSGGDHRYSFYSSVAYNANKSAVIGQDSKNYRLTLNQEYAPISRLKISLSTILGNNISNEANPINLGSDFLPYQLFRDEAGNSISMPYMMGVSPELRALYERRSRISLDYKPLEEVNLKSSKINNTHINLAAALKLNLWKGLSFNGNYGFQKAPGHKKVYEDHNSYQLRRNLVSSTVAPNDGATPIYNLPTSGGTYAESNYDERNWTLRNQLAYVGILRSGKDKINLQLGQEARESYARRSTSTLYGYDQKLLTYKVLNYGVYLPNTITGGYMLPSANMASLYESQSRFTSYFALGNYTFDDKYSLDASWRVDHSALFGSSKSAQNRPIWSIGGRWNLNKEKFLSQLKWLNGLSLRATYGITGNSPYTGLAAQWDILTVPYLYTIPLGGTYLNIEPKNDKLSWESTQTTNIGLDLSLFKSRINVSMDLYRKKTTDLLGEIMLNNLSGFKMAPGNIGDLRNDGLELSINTVNIQSRDFSWSISFNYSYNRNKLVSFTALDPRLNTPFSLLQGTPDMVGYSKQSLFSYDFVGLDASGNPKIRLADGTETAIPNSEKVEDLIRSGSIAPNQNGGLGNRFTYKAFTLSANMIFNLGNVMRADVNETYTGRHFGSPGVFGGNLSRYFLDRWKQPGDERHTNIPGYIPGFDSYSRRNTDYYTLGDLNVLSASYAKIRDITFSYSLPAHFLRKIKIRAASISFQATNFMVWRANDRGIDPEFHSLAFGDRSIPPYRHAYSFITNFTF